MSEGRSARSWTGDIIAVAILLALSGYLLAPMLDAGHLTDDYRILRVVTHGPTHDESFDPDDPTDALRFFWIRPSYEFELYRPLVLLSYAANYRFWGVGSASFMRTNLALHLLGGGLLFFLLRRLFSGAPRWALALGAALFLIVPVQLEVVVWTATRSDSLSWVFGCAALLAKVGRTGWRARILGAFLVALSMMAKEQGLAFLGLLVVLDVFPVHRTERRFLDRLRDGVKTGLVLLPVGAAYFGMRLYLFESDIQNNAYASKEFASFLSLQLWSRYAEAMLVMATPVSGLAFAGSAWALPLRILAGAGFVGIAGCGIAGLRRGPLGLAFLAGFLFTFAFILSMTVNPVSDHMVNSRAMYTPMAGLAMAAVTGIIRFPRVGAVSVLLYLGVSAGVSRSSQQLYVETHQGVEKTLVALRAPLADARPGVKRIAILGYRDVHYFAGSFTLSGSINAAVTHPFTARDFGLDLIEKWPTPAPEALIDVFEDEATTRITYVIDLDEDKHPIPRVVHPGAYCDIDGGALTLVAPASRTAIRSAAGPPRFAFESRALGKVTYSMTLCSPTDVVMEDKALPDAWLTQEGDTMTLALPVPPEVVAELDPDRATPFVWAIAARDEAGRVVARTPLRVLIVSR